MQVEEQEEEEDEASMENAMSVVRLRLGAMDIVEMPIVRLTCDVCKVWLGEQLARLSNASIARHNTDSSSHTH